MLETMEKKSGKSWLHLNLKCHIQTLMETQSVWTSSANASQRPLAPQINIYSPINDDIIDSSDDSAAASEKGKEDNVDDYVNDVNNAKNSRTNDNNDDGDATSRDLKKRQC